MRNESWHKLLFRSSETNKYDYGHVLIIGGSEAMVGAPVLASRAAMRVGAGLATIASTSKTVNLINRDIEETMTLSLPPWGEVKKSIDTIKEFIKSRHVSVVVVGPGLPPEADNVIRELLSNVALPLVLDAESFTALSGHLSVLLSATKTNKNIILTPHQGEYARLVKDDLRQNEDDEQADLKKFVHDYAVTVVLKHHHTLVASPQGHVYKNTTGNPGLATAGSGDVLTGVIAGLLAQGIATYEATQMAVYLHGLAGDKAAKSATEPGMIASDIIEYLPAALKEQQR